MRENLEDSLTIVNRLLRIKKTEVLFYQKVSQHLGLSDELTATIQGLQLEAQKAVETVEELLELLQERQDIFGKTGLEVSDV